MKLSKVDFKDLKYIIKHPQTRFKTGFFGGRYVTIKNIKTPSEKVINDKVSLNAIVRQLSKICEQNKQSFDDEKLTSIIEICEKIKAFDRSLKSNNIFTRFKRICNARIFGGNPKKEILKEGGVNQFISKYFKLPSINSIAAITPQVLPKKIPVSNVAIQPTNTCNTTHQQPSPAAKSNEETPVVDGSKRPNDQKPFKAATTTDASSTRTSKRQRSKNFIHHMKDGWSPTPASKNSETPIKDATSAIPESTSDLIRVPGTRTRPPSAPQIEITDLEIDRIAALLEESMPETPITKTTTEQLELDFQRIEKEVEAELKKCIVDLKNRYNQHKTGLGGYDQIAVSKTYTHDELNELETTLLSEYQQLEQTCNDNDPELQHKRFRCVFVQIQKKLSDFLQVFVSNMENAHQSEDAFRNLVLSLNSYEEFLSNLEWLPKELESLPETIGENPYDFDEKAPHKTQLELALSFYRQNQIEMKSLFECLMIVKSPCIDFIKKTLDNCSSIYLRDLSKKHDKTLLLVNNTDESAQEMELLKLNSSLAGLDWALYDTLRQLAECVQKDEIENFKKLKQEFVEFYTPFQNEYQRWKELICNSYEDTIPEDIQKENQELYYAIQVYATKLSYLNALSVIWQ